MRLRRSRLIGNSPRFLWCKFFLFVAWLQPGLQEAHAAPVCSTGSDGIVDISSLATRVNVYYPAPDPVSSETTVPAGSTAIPIDTTLGGQASNLHPSLSPVISAGDILIVMQMIGAGIDTDNNHQSTGDYGDGAGGLDQAGTLNTGTFVAGQYEFVIATGPVSGGAVPIEGVGAGSGLLNEYVNSNVTTATLGVRRYQIIKVPQFSRLTLSGGIVSDRWNGRWGGISALNMRAQLDLQNGDFNADGRGYRGGQFFPDRSDNLEGAVNGNFGYKGEGVAGFPQRLFSRVLLEEQPGTNGEESSIAGYPGSDGAGPAGTAWTRDAGQGAPGTAGSGGGGAEDAGGGGGGNLSRGGSGGQGLGGANSEGFGGASFPQHVVATPDLFAMGGGGGASNGNDIGSLDLTVSSGQAGGGVVFLRSVRIDSAGGGSISANGDSGGTAASEGGGGGGAGGTILIHTDNSTVDGIAFSAVGGTGGSNLELLDGAGGGGSGGVIWLSDTALGSATSDTSGGAGGSSASTGVYDGMAGGAGALNSIGAIAEFDCNFVTLGVSKEFTSQTRVGTTGAVFDLVFTLAVENFSLTTAAINVQIDDDLDAAFPNATSIAIQGTPDLGGFTAPTTAYDGVTQTDLLIGTDSLPAGAVRFITYTVRVDFGADTGPFTTQARVTSSQIAGGFAQVLDLSHVGGDPDPDGDGDPSETIAKGGDANENDATPVVLDFMIATDDDNDGIANSVEGDGDTDGDGIIDSSDTDSDNDGIPDSDEEMNQPPLTGDDTDGDGIDDALDVDNTGGMDGNGDGVDDLFTLTDSDGDGIPNYTDSDADGDGIPDVIEGGGDSDLDGIPDYLDTDSDNDGIPDSDEADNLPPLAGTDADSDGIDDAFDVDSTGGTDADANGIDDATEPVDSDGDGTPDYSDIDSDDDGIPDAIEGTGDTDSDGIGDWRDTDTDNDGILDSAEGPSGADVDADGIDDAYDADVTGQADADGNGVVDDLLSVDADMNGVPDADTDNDGVPDFRDLDADNDGINDVIEAGLPDADGDAQADAGSMPLGVGALPDADGDSLPDFQEVDSDNDGTFDIAGTPEAGLDADLDGVVDDGNDSDGDGIVDVVDGMPESFGDGVDTDQDGIADADEDLVGATDTDMDTIPDYLDLDSDNDGIPDELEGGGDADGDGVANFRDLDSDNDGIDDSTESDRVPPLSENDDDMDGLPNEIDVDNTGGADSDGNGADDALEPNDTDADAIDDYLDVDSDDDGIPDIIETVVDTDNDTVGDWRDNDSDDDGIDDATEADAVPPLSGTDTDGDGLDDAIDVDATGGTDADADGVDDALQPNDTDGDGIPDFRDADSDGDTLPDNTEGSIDSDGDGIGNWRDPDSDNDGVDDSIEGDVDTDGDGMRDSVDTDSDNDGIPDDVDRGDKDNDGLNDRIDADEGRLETAVRGAGSIGLFMTGILLMLLLARIVTPRRSATPMMIMVFALAFVSSPDALADNHVCGFSGDEFEKCWYAGAGLGVTHVDPEGQAGGWSTNDDSDSGWKALVGWQFNPRWSLELSYVDGGEAGLGNVDPALEALIPGASIDYRTPSLMAVRWFRDPDADWNYFLKIGASTIDNDTSDSRIPFRKQTDVQLAGGLGARWQFSDHWFLRGDIDFYDRDHSYAGLAIGARWGGRGSIPTPEPAPEPEPEPAPPPPPPPPPPADTDNDGIIDDRDDCPNTAPGVAVDSRGCEIREEIRLPSVQFETNSDVLLASAANELNDAARTLTRNPDLVVEVAGHTDANGAADYNLGLSERRAQTVYDYLIERGADP
ncbi:MAG: OmpA family protein, partial [Woeseiaceae bacterium]